MSNPNLTINRFAIRSKRAVVKLSYTARAIGDANTFSMGQAILDLITNWNKTGEKGYMTFTSYKKNHQKEDIEVCSAIMMEFPYRDKASILERLAELPYSAYVIDTVSDFESNSEARVLVAFPLETAITDPRLYTRVASLLWREIGIGKQSSGSLNSTFLFAPYIPNPSVQFLERDCFLDAEEYEAANAGRWVKTSEEPKPEPRKVSDDGLFVWGN